MSSIWDGVVGQARVVELLARAAAAPAHAYLFVGPPGSTKNDAARAFAAAVLAGGDDPTERDARLALAGEHPDVREVLRVGAAISAEQAAEIVRQAALAPVEGDRQVLILHEFHLLKAEGAGRLLKTIEEPPPSTHFIVLADFVPVELVTIASRCVRIDFSPIVTDVLAARLLIEGVGASGATAAAAASGGDLDRARLLAADPDFTARRRAFAELPNRLDGTGASAVTATGELLEHIELAAAPLAERHAAELAELAAREQRFGTRGSGRAALEAKHRRELRRHRTDELRSGLAAMAATYRDALVAAGDRAGPDDDRDGGYVAAVRRIHDGIESLEHNPNESLLLHSLLWSLPAIAAAANPA